MAATLLAALSGAILLLLAGLLSAALLPATLLAGLTALLLLARLLVGILILVLIHYRSSNVVGFALEDCPRDFPANKITSREMFRSDCNGVTGTRLFPSHCTTLPFRVAVGSKRLRQQPCDI